MTTTSNMNLNIFPSQFSIDHEHINNEEYYEQNRFSCDRVFYDSTTQDQYATRYYHQQLCQLPNQYDHIQEDHGKYSYDQEGKVESGFKLSVWKTEVEDEVCVSSKNVVKWMPSNIRVKKADKDSTGAVDVTLKINCSSSLNNQKLIHPSSSTLENVSSNNISYNTPVRVCSDCNTTKTPLWRSGPKGPKSLCNACGIRQRKARRAMAAAAAATTVQPPPMKIIKVQQHKEKNIIKKSHASKFKKHCKMSANASGSSSSNGQKKLNLEDFLINLSKNLAFQRVFPEDEKDAAILLMALSSGLVHG